MDLVEAADYLPDYEGIGCKEPLFLSRESYSLETSELQLPRY